MFCKRYDQKWFLTGIYNWINLKKNFIKPDFRTLLAENVKSRGGFCKQAEINVRRWVELTWYVMF